MKRICDVIFAGMGLVVLAPLGLAAALAIRLNSPGPVFFRQERMGRHGSKFNIFKFRTMSVQKSGSGCLVTAGGDTRITRVGRFLRRHKIDELPQLINVLRGEMSLVGPRPEVAEFAELFPMEYARILTVRPGITHPATLQFRREEAILAEVNDARRFYIDTLMPAKLAAYEAGLEQSLWADIRIILATVLPDLFHQWRVPSYGPGDFAVAVAANPEPTPVPSPVPTMVENIPAFAEPVPFRQPEPAAAAEDSDDRAAAVV